MSAWGSFLDHKRVAVLVVGPSIRAFGDVQDPHNRGTVTEARLPYMEYRTRATPLRTIFRSSRLAWSQNIILVALSSDAQDRFNTSTCAAFLCAMVLADLVKFVKRGSPSGWVLALWLRFVRVPQYAVPGEPRP